MIGICTDSSSQLPRFVAARFGIEVVPLTVTVDEQEYLEGVDIDADRIYELLAGGDPCALSVSQPSSGQFAAAYDELVNRGCTAILSVHTNSPGSNMLNAARLAAHSVQVPVKLVDTGAQSFGLSCCAWAAAEAAAGGAPMEALAPIVESIAGRLRNVFTVGTPLTAKTSVAVGAVVRPHASDPQPSYSVFTGSGDDLQPVRCSGTAADAVATMTRYVVDSGTQLRVGIGYGDRAGAPMADALAAAFDASPVVSEIVRYRIGASLAAHTPLCAVSCFVFAGE